MPTVFVKPAKGLSVPDPEVPGAVLQADGEEKPDTPYWRRRLMDGDVVHTTRPPEPKLEKKPTVPVLVPPPK